MYFQSPPVPTYRLIQVITKGLFSLYVQSVAHCLALSRPLINSSGKYRDDYERSLHLMLNCCFYFIYFSKKSYVHMMRVSKSLFLTSVLSHPIPFSFSPCPASSFPLHNIPFSTSQYTLKIVLSSHEDCSNLLHSCVMFHCLDIPQFLEVVPYYGHLSCSNYLVIRARLP